MQAQSRYSAPPTHFLTHQRQAATHWLLLRRGGIYAGLLVTGCLALASKIWYVDFSVRVHGVVPKHGAIGVPNWVCRCKGRAVPKCGGSPGSSDWVCTYIMRCFLARR